jgi:hypothetical protein
MLTFKLFPHQRMVNFGRLGNFFQIKQLPKLWSFKLFKKPTNSHEIADNELTIIKEITLIFENCGYMFNIGSLILFEDHGSNLKNCYDNHSRFVLLFKDHLINNIIIN